ncbi:hypothetical protein [Deinococcus fonticola]|uniref:hypothetical protein n=1 Tax=Deinococcus fonticola TaxID=2528713 RepID=UPI001074CFBE|nr:hypothetical protein [Deinococcus fonticola]
MILLPAPHGSSAYMTWLASQPCAACQRLYGVTNHGVQLHHLRVWGLPRRTNNPLRNYSVIPLCPAHHTDGPEAVHRMGEQQFLERLGTNADDLLLHYYAAYVPTRYLPTPPAGAGARQMAQWLLERESGVRLND